MKILLGITKSNFGGAQRYVFDLATEYKKIGHDVGVVCGGKGVLVDKLQHERIFPMIVPTLGRDISLKDDTSSFFKLLNMLIKNKPEVFHINSSKMGGIGAVAGRFAGVKKIIFTSHGWAFNEPGRTWIQKKSIRFFVWLTIIFCHHVICVSEKTKRDIENLPWVKNKLVVIHNGIQHFDIHPRDQARERLSPKILSSSILVGTLSELHKVKGLNILLEAWKRFIDGRNAKLVITSDGDEKENLQNMALNLGILDSVIFTGYIDNARSNLSGFDIFVMPSYSENLPYSLLEAGLAERSVIASNVGGIPEIIEDKRNGILVKAGNIEDLVNALIVLYDNPVDRNILGKALKETVETKFTIEKMVRDTLLTYGNTK